MKIKVSDRKTLVRLLKEAGFTLLRHNKHEVYAKGDRQAVLPNSSKRFSRILAERICREAGIGVNN